MTEDEYLRIVNNISNEEVAKIMFEALSTLHMHLEWQHQAMSEADKWIYCLFKAFFKMYNTTYHLSNGIPYFFSPEINYIDVRSINIQIRSCHEIYLTYNYITKSKFAIGGQEEREFKYTAYELAGNLDNKRTYERIRQFKGYKDLYDQQIGTINEKILECRKTLTKSPIYRLLSTEIKNAVRNGQWKITTQKKLSWADLLDCTPIPRAYGEFEYNNLCLYTHASHASLALEAHHDLNMISALAHLYKLAALMCDTTVYAFNLDDVLDLRTRALINDLAVMGNSIVAKAENARRERQEAHQAAP
ncbi:hypothetical protein [Pseudomonas alliivorans]|uniref:hypothetical protein n=1 Tax=Pseudomonas alliivorans TaxID=2810613 RepID=UPI00209184AD|nr:hypothetical protein [Pseudomonas alliivorans]MCO5364569.1 hypothetical protein [Pseudomonas alliivorans]MEE4681663.1 hypothetical protein [Pseudomonas alliivorans]MEE4896081.1 hypothetical protein [Pseudomonas alliivorans]